MRKAMKYNRGLNMPYQIFRIDRAPEEPPLKAEELKRLMWKAWRKSEWEVRELDKKESEEIRVGG